ncbi:MAG TPA: hypothetical protein VKQ72_18690, partial [Aggregatilineales bacterium]|nr:hypothetical protein [Aggregatilineales bacterium]
MVDVDRKPTGAGKSIWLNVVWPVVFLGLIALVSLAGIAVLSGFSGGLCGQGQQVMGATADQTINAIVRSLSQPGSDSRLFVLSLALVLSLGCIVLVVLRSIRGARFRAGGQGSERGSRGGWAVLLLPVMLILCAAITCASQAGLALAQPNALCVALGPNISANYAPWATARFVPVDPRLGTIAVQTSGAPMQSVAIDTPTPQPDLAGTTRSTDVAAHTQQAPTDRPTDQGQPATPSSTQTTITPDDAATQTQAVAQTTTLSPTLTQTNAATSTLIPTSTLTSTALAPTVTPSKTRLPPPITPSKT